MNRNPKIFPGANYLLSYSVKPTRELLYLEFIGDVHWASNENGFGTGQPENLSPRR